MLGNSEILIIEEMQKNNCVYLLLVIPLAIYLFCHVFLMEQNRQYIKELDKICEKIKEKHKQMKKMK